MFHDSQIREMRLLESTEISPIKIMSHRSNCEISTPVNCTVFEVCEEQWSNKENENIFLLNEISCNSSLSNKNTVASYNPGYGNLSKTKMENKEITRKPLVQKNNINKNLKIKPQVTNFQTAANEPPTKVNDLADVTQADLDSVYCQYIQSLYINTISTSAVRQQELHLMNQLQSTNEMLLSLNAKVNDLECSTETLNLTKYVKMAMDKKLDEIECLLAAFSGSNLEDFVTQLKCCQGLIEVDDDVEVGELSADCVSAIDGFVKTEMEGGNGVDLVGMFGDFDELFAELNDICEEQVTQAEDFKKGFIDYVFDVVKNVGN